MEYLGNLKNTVVNAFTTTSPPSLTRSDVLGLEENERSRRMTQVSQTQIDKNNAANISGLIKTQSFPIFRGNVSRGYKRVTTKFEEEERRRRLTNKSESALRRANANKTARMIQEMGWPFYQQNHSGPQYIVMDPTKLLEEEEREWRTSDSYWGPTAKHNAAMVANILRWGNFQKNPHSGFRQHVKFLEEKERRHRISNMELPMQNAYNESRLIKHMGPPFYVQDNLGKGDLSEIDRLEELERKRRMINPEGQQLAHELAGLVSGHLGNRENELEEQERGRRMMDVRQQNVAKRNAKQVSLMVRESSSNKIKGTGPMWFGISRNSMRALEEIERTRRLRDIEGQRFAKYHAKLISDMISGRLAAPPKPSIHAIEEGERQSRMLDRQQQQIHIKNARKVSGLIARHMLMSSGSRSFALALEESERTRRLQDQAQQRLARENARKVSNLVSSLNVAPGNKMAQQQAAPLPTYSAPVSAPTAVDIPRSASPLVQAAPAQPVRQAAPVQPLPPVQAAPIQSAPIQSAPIQSAPVRSAPIQSAPIQSAPIQQSGQPIVGPIVPLGAPVLVQPATPISGSTLSGSPTLQPIVLPTTSTPVPVAPLANTSAMPLPRANSFTTVPVDPAATAHPALGERERKRLLKQAEKHNRKSEKDVRKAEQKMLKAEKLHQKGRDDKAVKLENKAEQFMKNAEHERRWASGLQSELSNAPAPASM